MDAGELLDQLARAKHAYRQTLLDIQDQGGVLFRAIRLEYDLTQRELADALGVDHTFVSKVESGKMRPGAPVLERLAKFLEDYHVNTHTD